MTDYDLSGVETYDHEYSTKSSTEDGAWRSTTEISSSLTDGFTGISGPYEFTAGTGEVEVKQNNFVKLVLLLFQSCRR